MKPSCLITIVTRDGCYKSDILSRAMAATDEANRRGFSVAVSEQVFPFGVATGRNVAVSTFLQSPFTHLLMLDDDVLLPTDGPSHLLETASVPGRDIVCGPYPGLKYLSPTTANLYVTMIPLGGMESGAWFTEMPEGVQEIAVAGTGCMLISRAVFAAVGYPWFRWPEIYDAETQKVRYSSDDVDFCARASAGGFRIWADGRVRCGHRKTVDVLGLMDGSIRWDKTIPPRDANYGSHQEALRIVARKMKVRSVVEYGVGRYSTPLFLNREAFPDVDFVRGIETDPQWLRDIAQLCPDDRLQLGLAPIDRIQGFYSAPVDLVFIDCAETSPVDGKHDFTSRGRLLDRYSNRDAKVVVIHDSNFASIAPMVAAADYKFKAEYIPEAGPHTAILSNEIDVREWF